MRMFLVNMCVRKRSAKAGCAWRCVSISGLSTTVTEDGLIAVAVAIRCVWLARHPSPKKWPTSSAAIIASFPAWDRTDNRTAPLSTYVTLVAGSPCEKIVAPGW